ncbi:MAG: flap endonuclease-1 [Methanosarcinales archaeon]|nr:flap endonuclease-1 [Methanosarcinales archaeon]
MGIDLSALFEKKEIELNDLAGVTVAVDASNIIYQFLSVIRQRDGTPLLNKHGEITSHLSGMFYRTTSLCEAGIKPIFVFDGRAPELKHDTQAKRRKNREKAEKKWIEAKDAGGDDAFKYAQATSRLTSKMVGDLKKLLGYMGIPFVQAPSEGEAQAVVLVQKGDADYVVSKDYDALLFGAPRVIRNLTVTGQRKMPGKNVYVKVKPEVIELEPNLTRLEITQRDLIDLAVFVGTDFNEGISGIGPKKALKLVQTHESMENAVSDLDAKMGIDINIDDLNGAIDIFTHPAVSQDYIIETGKLDTDKIVEFLCGTHGFSKERVQKTVERLKESRDEGQSTLDKWF